MTIMELEGEIRRLRGQLCADHERLNYLERELQIIKQRQGVPQNLTAVQEQTLSKNLVSWPNSVQPKTTESQPNPVRPKTPELQPNPIQPPPVVTPPQPKAAFDWEKFIGKSWMGIMASVLIFISIVLFAVTLLPYMTDNVKMCLMYAVSMAFVVGGLACFKKSEKLFYMILSACGMGALYLSMLLSNIYFKAIGDVTLYIFIMTWAIGIAVVAKNSILTFSIVGNAGLVISIILGTVKCMASEDDSKFMVLMLFFILSAVIYGIINNRFYFTNTISNLIGMLFLFVGYATLGVTNLLLFLLLLGACMAQFVYLSCKKISPYFVFHLVHIWIVFILNGVFIYGHHTWNNLFGIHWNDYLVAFIIYGISLLSIVFMEFYSSIIQESDNYSSKNIIQIVDMGTIIVALLGLHVNTIWFLLLAPVVFFGFGYFKKDIKFTIAAVIALALSVFGVHSFVEAAMILAIGGVMIAMEYKREDAAESVLRAVVSAVMRVALIQFMCLLYNELEIQETIATIIILLLILIMDLVFKHVLSHEKRDRAVVIVADISCILCAMVVTATLLWGEGGLTYYMTLLVGCVIFMNNVIRFIRSQKMWKQLYGMFKISFYLMVILVSLEKVSIVLSIVFFVAAIFWILLGFGMEAKAVRLYGLVTSLISIAKLILVDIQYNSSLSKALGFFICGVLAFVISFIYNRFEKSNEKMIGNRERGNENENSSNL